MYVRDFEESVEVRTVEELQWFLAKRYEVDGSQVNSFWMCFEEDWPALGMLVRDRLGVLDYMADGEGTAFVSSGTTHALNGGDDVIFFLDRQPQPVITIQI